MGMLLGLPGFVVLSCPQALPRDEQSRLVYCSALPGVATGRVDAPGGRRPALSDLVVGQEVLVVFFFFSPSRVLTRQG